MGLYIKIKQIFEEYRALCNKEHALSKVALVSNLEQDVLAELKGKLIVDKQKLQELTESRPIIRYFRSTPYGKLTKKQFEDWFECFEEFAEVLGKK